jgi:hypothetical protein
MLYCEPCGYKRIVEVDEHVTDLPEIQTCPVQMKIPYIDPLTRKTVVPAAQPQAPKFKCPGCGRGVKLRDLLKPYADALQRIDDEKERKRLEDDIKKRLEDGKPPEKKTESEFLG